MEKYLGLNKIKSHFYTLTLPVLAFSLKVFYVIFCTSYKDSVHNDMAAYWGGALRILAGNSTSIEQYAIFPPFYIYFLAFFIKAFSFVGLASSVLTLTMIFNVGLYCYSSIFIYRMVVRLAGNVKAAVGAQIFYLLSYTAMNVNALVLPDNLSTPLFVIATGLLITTEGSIKILFYTGFLMGLAIAAKPFFAGFGLVFLLHILSTVKYQKWKKVLFLAIGLSLVPVLMLAKNYQISEGRLFGLGVNGGVNFFQGWGEIGKINSNSSAGYYWVDSPGSSGEANWKPFATDQPFYNQGYFYRKGFEAISNHPGVLLKKISWLKKLFFGRLGPFLSQHPRGYSQLMPAFNILIYMMFVTGLFFTPLLTRRLRIDNLRTFVYLIVTFFASVYVMGMPERRYLYYVEFIFITLFSILISHFKFLYLMHKREMLLTLLCMLAFIVCWPIANLLISRFVG